MTSIRFLEFLLFLLLHQVHSEEAEPVFKAEGSNIEMGYCFGVDYIVVYRTTQEGDQLLGNSSANNMPITPSTDFQDRINISHQQHLLGLQISHLTYMDSGIYRRECWQNQTRVNQQTQEVFVCTEEIQSEEIIVKKDGGVAELLCNSTSIGLEGVHVRWYHEMAPSHKVTLFLDSSVSLDPLVEDLQGVVEVRERGALLLINNSMIKNSQEFYCLVIKGKDCLGFQNMYLPDLSDTRDIFVSEGDRLVLNCPSDSNKQEWNTPLGIINGSNINNSGMYLSFGENLEDFSLIIPAVSDEHWGDYSCISSSLYVEYSLFHCPKTQFQEEIVVEGRDVLLGCDAGKYDSHSVQWYRLEPSGEHELIHDSNDKTVPIPEDLRGRLTENGHTLTISHLEKDNLGLYWCVVLEFTKFLEGDEDYEDDYDEDDTEDDEYSDDQAWSDTPRCVSKQETFLSFIKTTKTGPVTPRIKIPETGTTDDPSTAPNVTIYAVGAGLVVLVVGVIVAVVAIKRRVNASHTQQNGII